MEPRIRATAPPPAVLAAWGVERAVPLAGGQGAAFRAGDLVLKPVLDGAEAARLADVLDGLPDVAELRVIRPVRSRSGRWVVDGWAAWHRMEGVVRAGAWREALDVSRSFHALVAGVPWEEPLRRTQPWAIGDRYAWGEHELTLPAPCAPLAARLRERLEPVRLPAQLIHGDLINNILFHDGLPPAVIDVSPYRRPARYADAVVVVDAIGWEGAGPEAREAMEDPEGRQLMLRATLFRLASAVVLCDADPARLRPGMAAYERIEALALS